MHKLSADLLGAGITTLTFSVSVNVLSANVLSANFSFCVVPAGGEGGGNGKYVDVRGKRKHCFTHSPDLS
jgi:hypothetical protein